MTLQQNEPSDSPLSTQGGTSNLNDQQGTQGDSASLQSLSQGAGSSSDIPVQTGDNSITAEITLPAEAEDNDLIEKEWVERAKQIVEHTREDPYEQQRALSQMKADYLKKRYDKDIKISES